ncbi:MAG: hypothetical protein WA001_00905 [Patescibacteria group bacterium]
MDAVPPQTPQDVEAAHTGRPWWKVCCIGCLVLIVAVFVGGSLVLRLVTGPSHQVLSTLPANYPADLEPYRLTDAQTIVFMPGKRSSKLLQILFSPVESLVSAVGSTSSTQAGAAASFKDAITTYADAMQGFDTVTVSWKGLAAQPDDTLVYYSDLFKKAGMSVQAYRSTSTATDIVFAKRDNAAMQLSIQDTPTVPGIDDIELTVEYAVTSTQ